jgi:Tol biopolymer transport system component
LPIDTRSDQFSFGVILYELASGKRPFQRDSAPQTMAEIIEADPEPLPQTVPAPLWWMIERCLAKDPSARYESTRDLYRDLRSLRDHISEALVSSGSAQAAGATHPKRRLWPSIAVFGGVLVIALIAAAGYGLGVRGRSPASVVPVALTSSGGVVLNPSFSPDGSDVVFAWDGPRSGIHNLYVKLIGSNDLLRLTNGAANEVSPAWSPDGKQIAFVRSLGHGRRALMLISPLGGSERKLTEVSLEDFGAEGHSLLAWSPDGRYLAAANEHQLDLVSVETGEQQPLTREAAAVLGDADPAFSPKGDRLAFVRRLGPFSSRPFWIPLTAGYRQGGAPQEIHIPGVVTFSPVWDAQGGLLVAGGAPFGMRLYRTTVPAGAAVPVAGVGVGGSMAIHRATGRLIYTSLLNIGNLYRVALDGPGKISHAPERLTSTTGTDFFPHFSPDGTTVAFASFRFAQFGIWTIQTQSPLGSELAGWGDGLVAAADWAPDGKSLLLFGTGPQGLYQLYRVAVDTRKVTRLTEEVSHDIYPTYARDGQNIYFSSSRDKGSLKLYKMPVRGGPATLVAARSVVQARESADGRWLYFAEYTPGSLDRMPIGGGDIARVVDLLADPAGYVLAGPGLYYWTIADSAPALHYMDLETHRDQLVLQPAIPAVPQMDISPDGRWLCFPLVERNSQELMMIENE